MYKIITLLMVFFFFSSRRRHTRSLCDWSSDVCSSDLPLCRRGARLDGSHRYTALAGLERLAHLAHKERRYVHVGAARARPDDVLRHLQGLGYRVGALEAHAFGGHNISPDKDHVPQVIQGMGRPVQDCERMNAVVGV